MKWLFPPCGCLINKHTVVVNGNTETSLAGAQTQGKKMAMNQHICIENCDIPNSRNK